MARNQKLQWWVLVSAGLMLLGSFGPWVEVFGRSVAGTDGSNDGWLVVAAGALGGGLLYATRASRNAGVWALLGGLGGLAVTIHDRSHVQNAIDSGGSLTQALASVGWGLNLSLAASASLGLAGIVWLLSTPSAEHGLAAPLAPPAAAPVATPPSTSPPPG